MPSKRSSISRTGSHTTLDRVNLQILEALLDEPRLSVAHLARRIGMSAPAVTDRIARLQDGGVIAGYRLELNPRALGAPLAAYVRVQPGPGMLERIADLARRTPQVVECDRITGEDCFLMKVHVAAVDQLEAVLDDLSDLWPDHHLDCPVVARAVAPGAPPASAALNAAARRQLHGERSRRPRS
jgi:Lrp/AsnC family transcriptional regulator, leucine-responsive regulatory protein